MQHQEACISAETLYKYLSGQLGGTSLQKVEAHLSSCSECMDRFVMATGVDKLHISSEEESILSQIDTQSVEEKLARIRPFFPNATETSTKRRQSIFTRFANRRPASLPQRLKPAILFAGLVLVLFVGRLSINFYNTSWQIIQAKSALEKHHSIQVGQVRLAGDFPPSGIGTLMAEDEPANQALTKSQNRINRALSRQPNRPDALHVEAQIAILNNNYAVADSLLNESLQVESDAASINDKGIVAFKQNNFRNAKIYFERAIHSDSTFATAFYNLALVESQLNQSESARQHLRKFLQLEDNKAWQRAAQSLLRHM